MHRTYSSQSAVVLQYNFLFFFFCYTFLIPGDKQTVPNYSKNESKSHSSQWNKIKRLEGLSCVLKGTIMIVLRIVFRNCNRNQRDRPTTYWNILLSIFFIFIDLGDSYTRFILIFININTYRLPNFPVSWFSWVIFSKGTLYQTYIKYLLQPYNLMVFPKLCPKEETRHYGDDTCFLYCWRRGGNYISQDCFFEIASV